MASSGPPEVLACPVRSCNQPLRWEGRALRCPRGHLFDLARSGYINLLQPQDKKSLRPGDSRDAVQARRRTLQRGLGAALLQAIERRIEGWSTPSGSVLVDIGCGEGSYLAELAQRFELSGWGLDLSVAAADAAARAYPTHRWIVANADRHLPLLDGSVELLLSITSRKNGPEFRRVLKPDGHLVVVVPAQDDLAELRQAVLGRASGKDRGTAACEALAPWFEPVTADRVRSRHLLEPDALDDLLRGSYRAERRSQRARAQSLGAMEVTLSYEVLGMQARAVRPGASRG